MLPLSKTMQHVGHPALESQLQRKCFRFQGAMQQVGHPALESQIQSELCQCVKTPKRKEAAIALIG